MDPWRVSYTMIHSADTVVSAVTGAHRKLDELYQDLRQRHGAHQVTIITTQMIPPLLTEEQLIYVFLITYQIDGVGTDPNAPPPVKTPRGKAK